MITYKCDCKSKYKRDGKCSCDCPIKSRDVFVDFARRLGHFYAWDEISVTFTRTMPEKIVCASDVPSFDIGKIIGDDDE